jgi:phage shock protein PspC (stress-responsive transcriptional regulator)
MDRSIDMAEKRLKRSPVNKILGGLCGGLGEYFNVDPTIIRLIWVLAAFWIGVPAIIAYLIGLIAVSITEQKNGAEQEAVVSEQNEDAVKKPDIIAPKSHIIWGWLIIGVGVLILVQNLGFLDRIKEFVFPTILIIAGVWVLVKGFTHK